MSNEPHPLALPPSFSPDTLDVLTELYNVLQKVHETARESLQNQEQDPATGAPKLPTSTSTPSAAAMTAGGDGKRLTFKDVPNATDGIKHKLQRAREQVRGLPDMSRTVAEQDAEMRELEARIEKQRALLERLREDGLAFGKNDAPTGDRMET
ncbi:unnamed protein product [Clonostachys chloroleuca]|uniref:Mediator of RNA polymerase II transcription subunit 9 n=1 Tax=Clonostachys chloroleuca TaxID=1926264 RepID=A0AA35MAD5_9HYPO|nr:unnamed protein product [Clonostachys chloroleuca]